MRTVKKPVADQFYGDRNGARRLLRVSKVDGADYEVRYQRTR
jgi:hypothetical protein